MSETQSGRLNLLRGYFLEIVRDMIARGVVKHRGGRSLDKILKEEFTTVLGEARADVAEIAAEMGVGLLEGFLKSVGAQIFGGPSR